MVVVAKIVAKERRANKRDRGREGGTEKRKYMSRRVSSVKYC